MKLYEFLQILISLYTEKYILEIADAQSETEAEQIRIARQAANIKGQIKATKRIAKMLYSAEDVKQIAKEARTEGRAIAEEI